jgi:hypothetical protein
MMMMPTRTDTVPVTRSRSSARAYSPLHIPPLPDVPLPGRPAEGLAHALFDGAW